MGPLLVGLNRGERGGGGGGGGVLARWTILVNFIHE